VIGAMQFHFKSKCKWEGMGSQCCTEIMPLLISHKHSTLSEIFLDLQPFCFWLLSMLRHYFRLTQQFIQLCIICTILFYV
jgi:hypothetical protein